MAIVAAVTAVIGVIGLFVASRSQGDAFYVGGLVVFIAAIAVIFRLIAVLTHQPPRRDELDPAQP